MRVSFILLFIFSSLISTAQDSEFALTDSKILDIPKTATGSTADIASFIQGNFKTEREKFRAIYRWITYNIKYDTDSMYIFNWGADPGKKVTSALRRRKGVCENFTAVFNEIALKCKLRSFVVSGYTKQSATIDKVGHTWCAVCVDAEWLFCDPTWDEGFRGNANYFMISPSLFIETHMPFDPLWQLLDQPVSKQEFYKTDLRSREKRPAFNFADSVKAFLKLNELQQLEATISRIKHDGFVNDLEKNNLGYIEMLAGIIYEDRDMNFYNSAIDDLNKATTAFNNFIEYRNNLFSPEKNDDELRIMLTPVDNRLAAAEKKLDAVDRSDKNAQYDTRAARERLDNFREKVQVQRDFLKQYLSTPIAGRKKLFYN